MLRYFMILPLFAAFAFAEEKPVVVKVPPLSTETPAGWVSEKPANRLRSHQFKLASGDKEFADAEIAIFPDSSPDVMKNHDRWKPTVIAMDGVPPEEAAKVSKLEVKGATITLLDMTGTWKFRERPQDPKSKEEIRPEYRVIWAIITTKDETTHIRFTGPMKVVAKHYGDFEKFLKGLK
jgi:hypothetical protein